MNPILDNYNHSTTQLLTSHVQLSYPVTSTRSSTSNPIPPSTRRSHAMLLRSFARAAPSSSAIRGPSIRTALRNPRTAVPLCTFDARKQQTRSLAAHAISNPTLSQIEKRWEGMPPQEQAELWMALRDRMKNDWHELTLQERKAGTSVSTVRLFTVTSESRCSTCFFLRHIFDADSDPGNVFIRICPAIVQF